MKTVKSTPTLLDKQLEVRDVQLKLNVLKQEERDLQKRISLLNSDFNERVKKLITEASEGSEQFKSQKTEVFGFWDRLEEILVDLQQRSSTLQTELDENKGKLVNLQAEIKDKVGEKSSLEEQIALLIKNHDETTKRLGLEEKALTDRVKSLKDSVIALESNVKELTLQAEYKKSELDGYLKEFDERAEYLARKESDLEIYEARIRSKFEELFPDKKLILP